MARRQNKGSGNEINLPEDPSYKPSYEWVPTKRAAIYLEVKERELPRLAEDGTLIREKFGRGYEYRLDTLDAEIKRRAKDIKKKKEKAREARYKAASSKETRNKAK